MAADSEIELKDHYMGLTKGTVHLTQNTARQATDTAEATRGAVFVIDNTVVLSLRNNSTTAATLKGEGKVVTGTPDANGKYPTEIVGGPNGWQSKGTATDGAINFTGAATGFTITAAGTGTKSILTALGPGATITQNAVGSNDLNVATDTVIDLAGTATAKAGQIILIGNSTTPANAGKITFVTTSSSVQIGATAIVNSAITLSPIKIGNVAIGTSSASIYTDNTTGPDYGPGKFIGVKGTSANQTLLGGADNISIDSTQTVSN
jgi:hypothetical protein